MLFGTDEETQRFGDVRLFDYGDEPVVSAYAKIAQMIDLLPNNIIETFIRARAPRNPHDRIPLEQVNLSYALYAMQLAGEFGDILSWFKPTPARCVSRINLISSATSTARNGCRPIGII
jgi:hypothetical protein